MTTFENARQGLGLSSSLFTVVRAMYFLNREVRADPSLKPWAYEAKCHLAKLLYPDHCVGACKARQVFECYHTHAYRHGEIDECPKCHNSGIFAEKHFVRFYFEVGGVGFSWHFPAERVTWEVDTEGGTDCINHAGGIFEPLDAPDEVMAWAVWWYLLKEGVVLIPPYREDQSG